MHVLAEKIFNKYTQILNKYLSHNYANNPLYSILMKSKEWELAKTKHKSALKLHTKLDTTIYREIDISSIVADILRNIETERKKMLSARSKCDHDAGSYDAILIAMRAGILALMEIFDGEFFEIDMEDELHVLAAEYLVVLAYDRSLNEYDGLDHSFEELNTFTLDASAPSAKKHVPVDESRKAAYYLGSGFNLNQIEQFVELKSILTDFLIRDIEITQIELVTKVQSLTDKLSQVKDVDLYFVELFNKAFLKYTDNYTDQMAEDISEEESLVREEIIADLDLQKLRKKSRCISSQATTPSPGFFLCHKYSTPSPYSSLADPDSILRVACKIFNSGCTTPITLAP